MCLPTSLSPGGSHVDGRTSFWKLPGSLNYPVGESCPEELPNILQTSHKQEMKLCGIKTRRIQDLFVPAAQFTDPNWWVKQLLKLSQQVNGRARIRTQVFWITSPGPYFIIRGVSVGTPGQVIKQGDEPAENENRDRMWTGGLVPRTREDIVKRKEAPVFSLHYRNSKASPSWRDRCLELSLMVPFCPIRTYSSNWWQLLLDPVAQLRS